MIYNSIDEIIGKTPLLRLNNIEKLFGLKAKIYAKLESFNPTGSAKDRPALYIIDDAEKKGLIKKGSTIIEPTSGNTGIAISAICASRGYKAVIVMPDTMSVERIQSMQAYGAEVVLTDGKLGMQGAVERAKQLNASIEGSIIAGQFDNPANALSHYDTTGPEIYNDLDGAVDVYIAGVGTGGTFSGVAKYLKEQRDLFTVGVEPLSSPLISEGKSGAHKIQGIGANFVPENFDATVCDKIETVSDDDAYKTAKMIAEKEGVFVGISSGASLKVAIDYATKDEFANKNIVVVLPDTGLRYLSVLSK